MTDAKQIDAQNPRRLPHWPTISTAAAPAPASWSTSASPESPIPSGEGAARLHSCRRGSGDRGRGSDGPAAQGQGRAIAVCRHSGLDQGSVRHQGAGDPRRLARAGRFSAGGGRCARGGAAAPGRLRRDRPHQHDRVRLFRDRHQSALRHAEGRLAAQRRPCARRIVVGRGGVGRRRHGAWRARHRYRRLLPDSGGL